MTVEIPARPDEAAPAPAARRRPPRLAIGLLAALAWLFGSWSALRSLGWFPPLGAKVLLFLGWILVMALGMAVGSIKNFRLGWTAAVLFIGFALVAPSIAAGTLPGVKQPPQYPIPGRPWLAVAAAPDGTYDLYLMKGDAQHLAALGETSWTEESAALSPNRRQIVFPSNRYGTFDLFVMDLDSSGNPLHTQRLTDGPGDEVGPVWSPDGARIAYVARAERSSTVDVMRASGGTPTVVTSSGGEAITPAWSADGRWIAYSSPNPSDRTDFDIWIMRADGSDPRDAIDATSTDRSPQWSPDGRHIAFTGVSRGNWDVYLASSDGSAVRSITSDSADEDQAYGWSPDGSKVLFLSDRSHTGGTFLYFMDPDGTNVRLALRL
jgi:Tol biopolymer transport system component